MNKWDALSKLTKIAGAKPSESLQHVCTLIDDLAKHFDLYYRDLKNSLMELRSLKARVSELESKVISYEQKFEQLQHMLNNHANKLNKLPVYGEEE